MNYQELTLKKEKLDKYRPLPKALVDNLDNWFRVELTYSSNAIEGNTLTRKETALVVEKGLTVGGKTLKEHLEATNHAQAIDWVQAKVSNNQNDLTEQDVLKIHEIVLEGIDTENAGRYRNVPVRISGSPLVLPNWAKVPDLMHEFLSWIKLAEKTMHPVEVASEAHYRLVSIHPFVDGNGRTARLLMNLILLRQGYPFAIIQKKDRLAYISSLEKAQLGGSKADYLELINQAVNLSLDIYLNAVENKEEDPAPTKGRLFKIGEISKASKEAVSTIRHWTKEGLLQISEITDSGYRLYGSDAFDKIKEIHRLKEQRYSLFEIKSKLGQKD